MLYTKTLYYIKALFTASVIPDSAFAKQSTVRIPIGEGPYSILYRYCHTDSINEFRISVWLKTFYDT